MTKKILEENYDNNTFSMNAIIPNCLSIRQVSDSDDKASNFYVRLSLTWIFVYVSGYLMYYQILDMTLYDHHLIDH